MELIGRSHQSPFIGRIHELELLRGMLLETEQEAHPRLVRERRSLDIPLDTQRHPQCVILTGDAGIGKTRLAEELGREAQLRSWTVVWSHMYAQEKGIAYGRRYCAKHSILALPSFPLYSHRFKKLGPSSRSPLCSPN